MTTTYTDSSWVHSVTYSPTGYGRGDVTVHTRDGRSIARRDVPSWVPGLLVAGLAMRDGDQVRRSSGRAVNRLLLGRRATERARWQGRIPSRVPRRRTPWTEAKPWTRDQAPAEWPVLYG